MKKVLRILVITLLIFLGLGGISGAWMLLSDPSGAKFQWTVELLEGTPFDNFLIPGIILLVINGLLPLLIAFFTITRRKNFEWYILIQGCLLIGWLTAEILFNKNLYSKEMHPPFYVVGFLLMVSGIVLLRIKNRTEKQ